MALEEIEHVNIRKINLDNAIEIHQVDNLNSYSSLFIVNNEVIKIYTDQYDKVKFNIINLKQLIKKKKYLSKIKELVLPNQLINKENQVIGFTMPYIKGLTLEEIIDNKLYTKEQIKEIFLKILKVIDELETLPFNFCLADLHEKNVIVDSTTSINLIDCDGFVVDNNQMLIDNKIIMGKYLNRNYTTEELKNINTSGDYVCLLCMIINYLFKNRFSNIEEINEFNKYIHDEYLDNLIHRTLNIKKFKLTKIDIETLFNNINYYQENLKIYNDNAREKLKKELLRVRKMKPVK